MKLSKIMLVLVVMIVGSSLLLSAAPKRGKKYAELTFNKGDLFVTPQIGLYSGSIPFGASVEYAIAENIGVGATLMMWFGSGFSVFMPSADAAYHFTMLNVEKLDLFAGVGVGFAIVGGSGITGSSGLSINPFIAARYWFSEKMGVSLRANIGLIGDWTGVGSMLGIVFML
ncbi:MAG: hypothetical protein E4H23_00805 [Chrysiogenales bacterium]|nr:MAG: hypothetical protein E4H23_00805 [Chrysiogenales bacterium]